MIFWNSFGRTIDFLNTEKTFFQETVVTIKRLLIFLHFLKISEKAYVVIFGKKSSNLFEILKSQKISNMIIFGIPLVVR